MKYIRPSRVAGQNRPKRRMQHGALCTGQAPLFTSPPSALRLHNWQRTAAPRAKSVLVHAVWKRTSPGRHEYERPRWITQRYKFGRRSTPRTRLFPSISGAFRTNPCVSLASRLPFSPLTHIPALLNTSDPTQRISRRPRVLFAGPKYGLPLHFVRRPRHDLVLPTDVAPRRSAHCRPQATTLLTSFMQHAQYERDPKGRPKLFSLGRRRYVYRTWPRVRPIHADAHRFKLRGVIHPHWTPRNVRRDRYATLFANWPGATVAWTHYRSDIPAPRTHSVRSRPEMTCIDIRTHVQFSPALSDASRRQHGAVPSASGAAKVPTLRSSDVSRAFGDATTGSWEPSRKRIPRLSAIREEKNMLLPTGFMGKNTKTRVPRQRRHLRPRSSVQTLLGTLAASPCRLGRIRGGSTVLRKHVPARVTR